MLKAFLLSAATIALVATSADARTQVMISKDNRTVSIERSAVKHAGPVVPGNVTNFKYGTIAKNAKSPYFCCYGSTISGPSSFFGAAYGVAEQFIPNASGMISELAAGVGYVSGDQTVTLTLYADNSNNMPGTMIAQGTGTTDTAFGSCCGIVTVKIGKTKLTRNTPYWVAITTTGSNFEAAGFQVQNQLDGYTYLSYTSNGGSTWSSGVSETEYNPAIGVK